MPFRVACAMGWTSVLSRYPLVSVGDRKLVGRKERDDLGAARRHDDFFLDASRGYAVGRRAIGFDREHHARLQLHRIVEGGQAADDRPFVEPQADAATAIEHEGSHDAVEADL